VDEDVNPCPDIRPEHRLAAPRESGLLSHRRCRLPLRQELRPPQRHFLLPATRQRSLNLHARGWEAPANRLPRGLGVLSAICCGSRADSSSFLVSVLLSSSATSLLPPFSPVLSSLTSPQCPVVSVSCDSSSFSCS